MNKRDNEPCPFCRSTSIGIHENDGAPYRVECNDCGAGGPFTDTEEKAWALWNTRPTRRMERPTVDDVTAYAGTMNPVMPRSQCQLFVDHYESNGWKVGKNPMVSWRAAVRTWYQRWKESRVSVNKPQRETPVTHAPSVQARTQKMLKDIGL